MTHCVPRRGYMTKCYDKSEGLNRANEISMIAFKVIHFISGQMFRRNIALVIKFYFTRENEEKEIQILS